MKKFVSIISCIFLSIGSMLAQDNYKTVKGYVVDKNGNPIPGAEVMAPGGGESVITDSDGSFNLNVHPLLKKLSATYDGMTTKTLKIKPDKDLVFRLKKERVRPGFLNVVMGGDCNVSDDYWSPNWGIMAGMLGKWGFYGKGCIDWDGNFDITFGAIKSIYKRTVFIYAGIGFGYVWDYYDSNWDDWDYNPGVAGDFGFIFKTGRHFNLSLGYNIIHTSTPNSVHNIQFGVGYVF